MQAKVITSFSGKPDDEILARTIVVDEIITGDLAAVAVGLGWASDIDAPKGKKARQAAIDPDLDVKRAAAQQAVDAATKALATAQAAEQAADEASKVDAAKAVSDAQTALDDATTTLAKLG